MLLGPADGMAVSRCEDGSFQTGQWRYSLVPNTGDTANRDAATTGATLGSLTGGSVPVDEPPVGGPSVAPAQLPDLNRAAVVPTNRKVETVADVATRVSVEIARGTTQVGDLVNMARGSVFELDREAGDAVDVLVNGAMIARGDIVVVGKQLGVRITKICGPDE